MQVELTILGSNSALPAHGRHPSAQLLSIDGVHHLIDCGEGTQIQLSRFQIKRSRIRNIFISHLHGDHFFGLPGLISSYHHYQRTDPLHIYGPIGLGFIIDTMIKPTENPLHFDLVVHEIDPTHERVLIDTESWKVETVPLEHRIPTAGFLFQMEPKLLKLRPDALAKHSIPNTARRALQLGEDFVTIDGRIIPNSDLACPKDPPVRYAYLSDTRYKPELSERVRHFHTVYHESTFLHELLEKAQKTKHTTAHEAAQLAKNARIGRLIIGHFSSRYRELDRLLDEARQTFPNTHLAIEGKTFDF